MRIEYSERFLKSYAAAPLMIRRGFAKQAKLLLDNLRHPSLRAKKYDSAADIWQVRVTRHWRFYFRIENHTYHLIDIMLHPE